MGIVSSCTLAHFVPCETAPYENMVVAGKMLVRFVLDCDESSLFGLMLVVACLFWNVARIARNVELFACIGMLLCAPGLL